jgi:hypothetical protein
MTPEERAAEFSWKRCPGGGRHDAGGGDEAFACAQCNADVIRAAEDEALERAAQAAMTCCEECDREVMAAIRSLKSGGGR